MTIHNKNINNKNIHSNEKSNIINLIYFVSCIDTDYRLICISAARQRPQSNYLYRQVLKVLPPV